MLIATTVFEEQRRSSYFCESQPFQLSRFHPPRPLPFWHMINFQIMWLKIIIIIRETKGTSVPEYARLGLPELISGDELVPWWPPPYHLRMLSSKLISLVLYLLSAKHISIFLWLRGGTMPTGRKTKTERDRPTHFLPLLPSFPEVCRETARSKKILKQLQSEGGMFQDSLVFFF